ncbi:hypothetical protein Celaphus_00005761, partial [Cervus elaphus hippelaphus]
DSESQEPRDEFIRDPCGIGELLLEQAPRLGLGSLKWESDQSTLGEKSSLGLK